MNKRFVAACVVAMALAFTTGWAVASGDASAATAIGPQYAQLARLAGHWTVQQSMWTAADAPPVIDRGSATYAMVLGGRHLRQELRIASGKPFEGLGYIGYDDVTGKYYSSWMDTNFAGIILAHGTYDPASRTYQFVGEMAAKGRRCASCHTDSFAGTKAVARIAGQREEYLVKALHDYKSGIRSGGGGAAMADVAYPLSEEEITALAHYLSRL